MYLLPQEASYQYSDLSQKKYFADVVFVKKTAATATLDRQIIKCRNENTQLYFSELIFKNIALVYSTKEIYT